MTNEIKQFTWWKSQPNGELAVHFGDLTAETLVLFGGSSSPFKSTIAGQIFKIFVGA